MKLFPTVTVLVLCICLVYNVQQSYAKGRGKRNLRVRLYFLLVKCFIVLLWGLLRATSTLLFMETPAGIELRHCGF